MRRRDLLRASAGAVGGGAATLAALQLVGDANAQASLTLDIAGDSATLAPDAAVTAVRLDADIEWAYDLPDQASPSTVVVELAAGRADGERTRVASAESTELFAEAEGSESFDVDLIAEGALDADALAPDSGERETTVSVEARLRVENSGGEVLARASATDTAPVTISREDAPASQYGEVGGSGSLTIETE